MTNERPPCRTCQKPFSDDDFYIDGRGNTGYRSQCKDCDKAYQQRARDITKGKLCKKCLAVLPDAEANR